MPGPFGSHTCPGAAGIRGTPELDIKTCPECGAEVEVFSDEVEVPCDQCGFTIYNDLKSCVSHCSYASDCVGEEARERLARS